MKNLRIKIFGQVRKTGFLFFVKQFSKLYHISGFIKYTGETSLLIEAEGSETNLSRFLDYCKAGPSGSIIKDIRISEGEIQNYQAFEVIENVEY